MPGFRIVSLAFLFAAAFSALAQPHISGIRVVGEELHIESSLPDFYDYVVLRQRDEVHFGGIVLLAGDVPVGAESVRFVFPIPESQSFFFVEGGHGERPPAKLNGASRIGFVGGPPGGGPMPESWRYHHTLNRLGYGPSLQDLDHIRKVGVQTYIEEQLRPGNVIETDRHWHNFNRRAFHQFEPGRDIQIFARRQGARYYKGTRAPPAEWIDLDFDAAGNGWLWGDLPIGRAQSDVATRLEDMQLIPGRRGYLSVYLRIEFEISDPSSFDRLVLKALYDDGFVAYLNGKEFARANMSGVRPRFNARATNSVDLAVWKEFVLPAADTNMLPGRNVLAVQMHNADREDPDSYFDASLVSRDVQAENTRIHINGIESLKDLLHFRGIYSKRQLQAVLGEFWENHFTTDYDKVVQYLDELEDDQGRDVMARNQAAYEAAQIEYAEYDFFLNNALGHFGDLLLFSATSPSQLIYLDNVLNRVGEANENYAREILELFSFGVDNRYTQSDIEALARAFTGWQVRKVRPENLRPFPESARRPLTRSSLEYAEHDLFPPGTGWRYYVGSRQPFAPGRTFELDWTRPFFSDESWTEVSTPFGFDAFHSPLEETLKTNVPSIRGRYSSVYFRRSFTVESPEELENLYLAINYDDGFVAYLNGLEIGRSDTMPSEGVIPSASTTALGARFATEPTEYFDMSELVRRLLPPPNINILSIQVHNRSRTDETLYLDARLVTREKGASGIELDDVNGLWTFRFNPDHHDFGEKRIFEGTPYEVRIEPTQEREDGVEDALRVIDTIVEHPSTAEFICLKLINRFVSDDITLDSYHNKTADVGLLRMMDRAIAAWTETKPVGNIENVLRTIFLSDVAENYFWSREVFQSKIKTPFELINSSLRVIDWQIQPEGISEANELMGMHFFTRNDPDGWSEKGFDWMSTGGLLNRIKFAAAVPQFVENPYLDRWNVRVFLTQRDLLWPGLIVDYFDELMFGGQLTEDETAILFTFANSDSEGRFSRFRPDRPESFERASGLLGLILASPQFQFQ